MPTAEWLANEAVTNGMGLETSPRYRAEDTIQDAWEAWHDAKAGKFDPMADHGLVPSWLMQPALRLLAAKIGEYHDMIRQRVGATLPTPEWLVADAIANDGLLEEWTEAQALHASYEGWCCENWPAFDIYNIHLPPSLLAEAEPILAAKRAAHQEDERRRKWEEMSDSDRAWELACAEADDRRKERA